MQSGRHALIDKAPKFARHRLTAGVVGLTTDVGVSRPVRDQAKQSGQGFPLRHGLVTHIRFPGSTNESRRVTRPDIVLAYVNRWLHTKMSGVTFTLLDGLVMAAHSDMLASSIRSD